VFAHHLPGVSEIPVFAESTADGEVQIEHATLQPDLLARVLDAIAAARAQYLVRRPVGDVIATIAGVTSEWRQGDSPWRAQAERALPPVTGLSPAMVREVLPTLFSGFTAPALHALVDAETGPHGAGRALDTVVATPAGDRLAVGPELLAHIGAGNVPGLGIPALVVGLLAKSAVLIKTPRGEPVLTALVARSLAERDPDLGACVGVVYWPGGTPALDDILLARASVVTVEGDDETVASVRARARGRVLGFGRRLSLAVVTREALASIGNTAEEAARAVSLYDQQGCLSPQVVYVEDERVETVAAFAQALGAALLELDESLPRGVLSPAEHAAVRELRADAEWRAIGGEDVRVFGDTSADASASGSRATVIYESDPRFAPTCGNRTVRVKALERIDHLPDHLGPWASHLEAVGVAGPPERIREIALALAHTSTVSRVCPLAAMQEPPLGWHRGGVGRLASLLRWVDVETDGTDTQR
jgi:hypothetical protein